VRELTRSSQNLGLGHTEASAWPQAGGHRTSP